MVKQNRHPLFTADATDFKVFDLTLLSHQYRYHYRFSNADSAEKSLYERVDECKSLEKINGNSHNSTTPIRRKPLVRAALHDPAYLHCPIPQFPDQIASWSRERDKAILTHGELTFTSDSRFQLSLKQTEHDWVLIIRRAELADSACYLCEINTEPNSTIYTVYLEVDDIQVPKLTPPEKKSSTKLVISKRNKEVLLNCTISIFNGSLPLDGDVIWTRDGNLINSKDSNKYILKAKRNNRAVVQTLQILEPTHEDEGTYACFAADAPVSSHLLQIESSSSLSKVLEIDRPSKSSQNTSRIFIVAANALIWLYALVR